MKPVIELIILGINQGLAFDSHYVIDRVIRDFSNEYIRFVASNLASSNETEYAHSQLAKVIAGFEGTLIQRMDVKSYSFNIRGNSSECTLWLRI